VEAAANTEPVINVPSLLPIEGAAGAASSNVGTIVILCCTVHIVSNPADTTERSNLGFNGSGCRRAEHRKLGSVLH
jgi:hypothetical protein